MIFQKLGSRSKKLYWQLLEAVNLYQSEGLKGLHRRYSKKPPIDLYFRLRPFLEDRVGLEIGGPTPIFSRKNILPIYSIARRIDNCNFGVKTFWQESIQEGFFFEFDRRRRPGYQYILDAVNLNSIPSNTYDFVLSSHNLEHIANPIAALKEWVRLLQTSGYLILILPHKEKTFDHRRPVTSMAHLIEDYRRCTSENDQTHLAEIFELHDVERDASVKSAEEFYNVANRNFSERRLHHHVFDTSLAVQLLDYLGLKICEIRTQAPFHIISVAQKVTDTIAVRNDHFLGEHAEFRHNSIFPSDRKVSTIDS